MEKFNAFYNPIRDKIGNIGVIAAGFGLIVLSIFIRTGIFAFLLDLFGALGILFGIAVSVIGIVMLGIEKGWWNGPAGLNGQPTTPTPQGEAIVGPAPHQHQPAPHYAEAQAVPPSAPPLEPPPQPEYIPPPPAGTYAAPMQEQYAPPAYPPQPQQYVPAAYPTTPQQGGIPLPDFVIRNQGNILLALLMIFAGGILWGIFAGILGAIAGVLLGDTFLLLIRDMNSVTLALIGSVGAVGAGILGGVVMAGETRKAIYVALLYMAISSALSIVLAAALNSLLDSSDILSSVPTPESSIMQLPGLIESLGDYLGYERFSDRFQLAGTIRLILEILISSVVIPAIALVAGAVIGSRIAMKRTTTISA